MAQSEFKSLDFYGKLDYMLGICGEARRGLERIVSADAAWRYITEVCDQLERGFATFREDEDFSNAGNFRVSYRSFSASINDVREIVPLIKIRQADYSYLLCMLRNLIDVIGENYPDNVQLARMFKTLINNKSELAKSIDADEAEVERVLSKC